MSAIDSKRAPLATEKDRRLIKQLATVVAAIALATFALSRLYTLYSHKFFDVTGEAQWIWAQHPLARRIPIAFFATRDFDLPADRYFTKVKVAADPDYTLYFNGQLIGGRRGEDGNVLDVYDVSKLARTGRNRIVIAVRSANGVGGVIAAVDIHPDFKNLAPTGTDWHIVRRWRNNLPLVDPPPPDLSRPMLLGRPPARRWNYLTLREGEFMKPVTRAMQPRRVFPVKASLPDINVIGGVAVAGSHETPAVAYEFEYVSARAQLSTTPTTLQSKLVQVRFANAEVELAPPEGDLEEFVFAPGEETLVEPREHEFRYVMVYGGKASATAVQ